MNDIKSPGLLHAIACNRSVRTFIDPKFRDVTHAMHELLTYIPSTITKSDDVVINGSSWEMAAVMSLCRKPGVYTGTVEKVEIMPESILVTFGAVPYVYIKDDLSNNLKTSKHIDKISLPRDI
jgi:hypothetical protein